MSYEEIAKHYETCLEKYKEGCKAVDWPNQEDLNKRYRVMLDLARNDINGKASLLDFGCGLGGFCKYYIANSDAYFNYTGVDISRKFIEACKQNFPDWPSCFIQLDILYKDLPRSYDYIVCNGVFTEKLTLSQTEMFDFFSKVLTRLWEKANKGLAFNIMDPSKVDWRRDDLFFLNYSQVTSFIKKQLNCENYVLRCDYGLREYTVYLYKC